MNPQLPFIDHYMVQLAVKANVPWRNFTDGHSSAISGDQRARALAWDWVRRYGTVMIHSVKAPEFWEPLAAAHAKFLTDPDGSDQNPWGPPLHPSTRHRRSSGGPQKA